MDWIRVARSEELPVPGSRKHLEIRARFVSIIRGADGTLHCLDSVCYHTGGPLMLGDIEEVNGVECIRCPWHNYPIRLLDGAKPYRSMELQGGKLVPAAWGQAEKRQRVHSVDERADGIYVRLSSELRVDRHAENAECESDRWAYHASAARNVAMHEGRLRPR